MSEDKTSENLPQQIKRSRHSAGFMFVLVAGMFVFGFALAPLYKLICEVTGINGAGLVVQRDEAELLATARVDLNRLVTVEFDATNNENLPWDFYPMVKKIKVHPGEIHEVSYYARNNADHAIVGQAVPGVTPWQATDHFNKTECFCFTQQKLEAGEGKEMKLRFVIDPALPPQFKTITLSYTFMDTDRSGSKQGKQLNLQSAVNQEITYKNI